MEPIRLAIVGCGGMGRRHLAGLAETARCGVHSVDLVAAVDGATARRAVALVQALFESSLAGRPVTIAEVETSAVDAQQREIDAYYGLVA